MAATSGTVLSTKTTQSSRRRKKEVDVLVQWHDGSQNVVSNIDLVYRRPLRKSKPVKMKWGATWWGGQVIDFESSAACSSDESCDDVPLASLRRKTAKSMADALSPDESSDGEPLTNIGHNTAKSVADTLSSAESSVEVPLASLRCKTAKSVIDVLSSGESSDDEPLTSLKCKAAKSVTDALSPAESSDGEPLTSPGHNTAKSMTGEYSSDNSLDDVSLASLRCKTAKSVTVDNQEKEITSETAAIPSTSTIQGPNAPDTSFHTEQLNPLMTYEDVSINKPEVCSNFSCKEEVFASCSVCQCLLCFEHFISDTDCESHNEFFYAYKCVTEVFEEGTKNIESDGEDSIESMTASHEEDPWVCGNCEEGSEHCNSATHTYKSANSASIENISGALETVDSVELNLDPSRQDNTQPSKQSQPEDFVVDGESRTQNPTTPLKKVRLSRNRIVKENRNSGVGYFTEKNNKYVPGRKYKSFMTCSEYCKPRGLSCQNFSEVDRYSIRMMFFTQNLQKQREWIVRHTVVKTPCKSTRKAKHIKYYLPFGTDSEKRQVCKQMFLSTLGISERQVRTVVKKMSPGGMLEEEKRGGRQTQANDQKLREEVRRHIQRFPKMESHYCRADTRYQYLSRDLNVNKMYDLYVRDQPASKRASQSLYRKVLKEMKLKFHAPKKDLCGICETFNQGSEEEKERIRLVYEKHNQEKVKVREIKAQCKTRAIAQSEIFEAMVFDLQQVIYLPKSERGEIFYKRRLSCYNFTVFELSTKAGTCYFHHEGQARRGSNEVASNLYTHLKRLDNQGKQEVALFCDGCPGQNKNTIVPTMLHYFVSNSKSIQRVTLYFFATNHGQSEGDSMHSAIERCLRGVGDIFIPSQLAALMSLARRNPEAYRVVEVQTSNILDWKEMSKEMHLLRARSTVEGDNCDWTKVMQINVDKKFKGTIKVKMSHLDDKWGTIDLKRISRHPSQKNMGLPKQAYEGGPPKLSSGKFEDLMSLCRGPTPVVMHPDHVAFFENLPHQVTKNS